MEEKGKRLQAFNDQVYKQPLRPFWDHSLYPETIPKVGKVYCTTKQTIRFELSLVPQASPDPAGPIDQRQPTHDAEGSYHGNREAGDRGSGKVKQQIAFSTGKGDVLHIKLRETVIRNQFSKILWNATRTIQSFYTGPELAYMFSDLASRVYSGENRGGIPSRKCGRTSLRVQLCNKCNKCDDD